VRGVAAIYQRGQYLEDRRAALEAIGDHIEALANSAGGSK